MKRRPGGGEEGPSVELLRRLCRFEKHWLSRGLSLEDIDYYSLPGHEPEALEALGPGAGERFLEEARLWFRYTFEYGIESACRKLEEVKREKG